LYQQQKEGKKMKKTLIFLITFAAAFIFATNVFAAGLQGDFDGDGDVDGDDLKVFSENYGKTDDSCTDNDNCAPENFCAKEPGDCNGVGNCSPKPSACPDLWDPVCGCDAVTYSNACAAKMAGVNVAYKGECQPNSCTDNDSCVPDNFCKKATGDCSGIGKCTPKPSICPLYWDPVCGCDAVTYSNPCAADMAGVNIAYIGDCRPKCYDGSVLICDMIPPTCGEYEILAIQNGCWLCVNPATCKPWGEPGCREHKDCQADMICDPCGTSSCYYCDDCVPACVSD